MAGLREERERRGWKKLQAVSRLQMAAQERRVPLSAQRESLLRQLARWENGTKPAGWAGPDEPYRSLLCAIYETTPSEFGWAAAPGTDAAVATQSLSYHPSTATSLASLSELGRADAGDQLSAIRDFTPDRLSTLALDWMFTEPVADLPRQWPGRVTDEDVREIRDTTHTLDQLDRQVGGEQSRQVAVRYLRDRVLPRLDGQYTESVGRDLFHAAAVLCEVIGWSAYDMGRHAVAQRYFTQALRLTGSAEHRRFGAYVLTSLSDQALFLRHPREALRLAQAATDSARSAPAILTEAALLEARAQAVLQDRRGCAGALTRAEAAFNTVRSSDVEDGATTDHVILSSHAGTCWVDLGDPRLAAAALTTALEAMTGQARRRVYGTIQLAKVALLRRDADRACALGLDAVNAMSGLPSHRTSQLLRDLAQQVEALGQRSASRAFLDQARATLTASAG